MKKLLLIACCLVGSTQSACAMDAMLLAIQPALPAITIGAASGGGIPFVAGLGYAIVNKKANLPYVKQGLWCVTGGALVGGMCGSWSYKIAKYLFADFATYALVSASMLGTFVGCSSTAVWGISNLNFYR